MKAELLERLIGMTRGYLVVTDYEREALDAATSDELAMRTPITPESLEADGWKLERYTAGVYSKTIGEVTVRLDAIAKMFAFGKGSFLWVQIFATSIHDLRQLERLIGGAR